MNNQRWFKRRKKNSKRTSIEDELDENGEEDYGGKKIENYF